MMNALPLYLRVINEASECLYYLFVFRCHNFTN